MKRYFGSLTLTAAAFLFIVFAGCQESPLDASLDAQTDYEAYLQLIAADSSLASFEPNYNEDGAMEFLGKVNTPIFPFRVGHHVKLVNRVLTTETINDTTFGTLTSTFEGTLIIAASFTAESDKPDTLIRKPFTSVVTRKIIFARIARTNRPLLNWKIAAISLPEGGTLTDNIQITKLTLTYEDGEQVVITSPNDYFLVRHHLDIRGHGGDHGGQGGNGGGNPGNGGDGHIGAGLRFRLGFMFGMPQVNPGEEVKLTLEVTSAYADSDFVTLTYNGRHGGTDRSKKKFNLISSQQSGNVYLKVYEQTYVTNNHPGFFHAVINVMPSQAVLDDASSVEAKMWGVPYEVHR